MNFGCILYYSVLFGRVWGKIIVFYCVFYSIVILYGVKWILFKKGKRGFFKGVEDFLEKCWIGEDRLVFIRCWLYLKYGGK